MWWIQASMLAVAALVGSLHTLVLTTGERLEVREEVRIEEGLVVFRAASGSLYSIPLAEIDLDRTQAANDAPLRPTDPAGPRRTGDQARIELERMLASRSLVGRQLVVSEEEKRRLVAEAAKSNGTAAPASSLSDDIPEPAFRSDSEPANSRDEWYWRERSRVYQERVTMAKEEIELLVARERHLQDEILGLLSLGYNPNQFNLQVLQLANTRDSLPRAQLNLERAERQLAQFRDDARRQGILPGWLR